LIHERLHAPPLFGDDRVDGRVRVGRRVLGRATQRASFVGLQLRATLDEIPHRLELSQTTLGLDEALLGLAEGEFDPPALRGPVVALEHLLGSLDAELGLGAHEPSRSLVHAPQHREALAAQIQRGLPVAKLGERRMAVEVTLDLVQA
jgi:hypothetical protein